MRILAVAPALPQPDRSSGELRFHSLLAALAARHEVSVLAVDPRGEPSVPAATNAILERLRDAGVRPLAVPFVTALRQEQPDVVVFEFYTRARTLIPFVWCWRPCAMVVVDSVDVHFRRFEAKAAISGDPRDIGAARTGRADEMGAYARADLVIAVTERDRDALVGAGLSTPITIIPNFHAIAPRMPRERRRPDTLLFVGSFRHDPNVDGMRWFLSEVFPRVREEAPKASITIIGEDPPEDLVAQASESVNVLGHIPDITSFLEASYVSIAPLRYGAGLKGKVGQAMAFGLPVVTTSVGAEGFGVTPGRHLLVADTAEEFAHATVRVLRDAGLHDRLSDGGRQFIEANYSDTAVARLALAIFDSLARAPRRPVGRGWRASVKTRFYTWRYVRRPVAAAWRGAVAVWGRHLGWRFRPDARR